MGRVWAFVWDRQSYLLPDSALIFKARFKKEKAYQGSWEYLWNSQQISPDKYPGIVDAHYLVCPVSPVIHLRKHRASLVAQSVKNLPVVWETQVWSMGREDPLEEGTATQASILAWRTPWTEEPGGLHGVTESDMTAQLTFSLSGKYKQICLNFKN